VKQVLTEKCPYEKKVTPSLLLKPSEVRRPLLAWYRRHGRHDLPWRGRFDPYGVLVSELMLQQTTVGTVIPYFQRFMASFPTFEALAQSPLERVLEHWAGLGYYARARNLHRVAQRVVLDYKGALPKDRDELLSLPGVGPYTAGALLSFAFDRPAPVVDGNVARVLARFFGLKANVKDPSTVRLLWRWAQTLVPPTGARHFNSALMDFGSIVCRPASPDCSQCPLKKRCQAYERGEQEDIPVLSVKPHRPLRSLAVVAYKRDDGFYLRKRPLGGLWGGLWEFPYHEGVPSPPVKAERLADLRHVLSHRDFRVSFWLGKGSPPSEGKRTTGWFRIKKIKTMAISSLTQRLLGFLEE